ncbi:hypothetical protein INT44_002129 [Umbelopsis vinacea]|uniref:Uncharacterized protein n=1 Tax=Umbelopsis vinacea TaxID=44442 RepID=A0A8H7Q2P1_9FUNG|nr:hypothetical protein INT44_002129 [Umbelopsis vinacea]
MSSTLREVGDNILQTFTPDDHNEVKADESATTNNQATTAAEAKTSEIKGQGNISADSAMKDKAQSDSADRSARNGGSSQPTQ